MTSFPRPSFWWYIALICSVLYIYGSFGLIIHLQYQQYGSRITCLKHIKRYEKLSSALKCWPGGKVGGGGGGGRDTISLFVKELKRPTQDSRLVQGILIQAPAVQGKHNRNKCSDRSMEV